MLELKNVIKNYEAAGQEFPVLKGLNLTFRQSEFVSILGQSGCGKTTLLNIIGGLDHLSSGDLIINGKSTHDYTARDWDTYRNHSIGFVFQSYNLIPHQTILQNVELALSIGGISKKERRARAADALQRVGLGDHIHKKPNQLSGGQCQRVSIARALVNDPDIILADEPTGALDSETSVQVMDILKEIANDRLVIMVTHNPELAEKYSTRIVSMKDGVIEEDTHPVSATEYQQMLQKMQSVASEKPDTAQKSKKSAMSFWTSIMLSFKNLMTKKRRTILTAFACSIGIIGIAVVLSVSSGMQAYINSVQTNSASINYVSIASSKINMGLALSKVDLPEYPANSTGIYPYTQSLKTTQIIDQNYTDYLDQNISSEWLLAKKYTRKTQINVVSYNGSAYIHQAVAGSDTMLGYSTSTWNEILDNVDTIEQDYQVIASAEGKGIPQNYDEIALVVDKYNRISASVLGLLGFDSTTETINFDDIIGHQVKLVLNDDFYHQTTIDGNACYVRASSQSELAACYDSGVSLKIVSVLRQKSGSSNTWLNAGVAYPCALTDYVLEQNATSQIAAFQLANPTIDVFTGTTFDPRENSYQNNIVSLGASAIPATIYYYPKDFDAKTLILEKLDYWNSTEVYRIYGNQKDEAGNYIAEKYVVEYTDASEVMGKMLNDTIDIITYALLAFSAISLVVSSIMIAIITYASVIERIKEIGVLRSLGARKRDVGRVFRAEACIIGAVSAIIALVFTLIINLIINSILASVVGVSNIAALTPFTALMMIVLCVGLNLIASLIPARIAANKDPVVALRTE